MSNDFHAERDRWEELKVAELLFGLTAAEQTELAALTPKFAEDEAQPMEQVIAALDITWADAQATPLPEHLREKILQQAQAELRVTGSEPTVTTLSREPVHPTRRNVVPWLVAAACLAFAAFVWFGQRPAEVAQTSAAQLREELLRSGGTLVQVPWSAGPTPIAGVTGDVVWDSQLQQGYMRFSGLPINMPNREQYQLWIFDKNQSDKTPIDGGVFDITSAGEVVVPIDAKLHVQEPFMFAVTIEKPGGVVVSSRERLPLLAQVE